ncbi:MAG: hypothetical protein QOD30_61 [Actinomycetota bacterium]|jgi:uncharacterized protein (TIGR03086 family)|nr:hypothetical protein [Actinomycetota bacterium]
MADENVERYTNLADQFGARVEAAPDDAWDKASPCEGWAARDIVKHVTDTQRRITWVVKGNEGDPPPASTDDPKALWGESYAAFKDALATPGALERNVPGPMGEMPAAMFIGRILSSDVLVHTWDLARAVGGDEKLDATAVTQSFSGLKPMDAMIRQPGIFGAKVDPAADADEQEQLLNFLGRVTRP